MTDFDSPTNFTRNVYFGKITPVDSQYAGRTLNTWFCSWLLTRMIVVGIIGSLTPLLATATFCNWLNATPGTTLLVNGTVLVAIWSWMFLPGIAFPGCSMDRQLCRRLLKTVELRDKPVVSPFDPDTRVVELVPRDRWQGKLCLDTATDLMMIRVDESGLWMKGDWFRYELPAESLLCAHVENLRSPGGFYQIFMIVVQVRTVDGTIELPISYRDHRWGCLRSSARFDQANQLADRINSVSKGHWCHPPQPPITQPAPRVDVWSENPYAAPSSSL